MYQYELRNYLHGLDRPLIIEIGFVASFAIACTYEIRGGISWRLMLIGCLSTGFVFLGGAWLAQWFRAEYVGLLKLIQDDMGFVEWIGKDMHAALSARMVGYGGCFALGLLVMRLTAGRTSVREFIKRVFLLPQHRPNVCPCCGKTSD